jgi:glycosyltransferase involved in cell wall biosynthesis
LDFPFPWRNGECGYLVEENPRDLADAIAKVLLKGNEMSDKCRELALKHFSFESVGRRYLAVFEQVLNT